MKIEKNKKKERSFVDLQAVVKSGEKANFKKLRKQFEKEVAVNLQNKI